MGRRGQDGQLGPPLPGGRSAVKVASLRPSSTRDSHGANRRLPRIRTLDIWEHWRSPTPRCLVDHPPNNVAHPTPRMTASSLRKNKRKREPAPLEQPSHSSQNLNPPGDLPLNLRRLSTRRSEERPNARVERRSNTPTNPINNPVTLRQSHYDPSGNVTQWAITMPHHDVT